MSQKENKSRQLKEIRKTMHEQNRNINKKIKTIKKNQTETLELKGTITVLKTIITRVQHQT